jgi:hypothetical protein
VFRSAASPKLRAFERFQLRLSGSIALILVIRGNKVLPCSRRLLLHAISAVLLCDNSKPRLSCFTQRWLARRLNHDIAL